MLSYVYIPRNNFSQIQLHILYFDFYLQFKSVQFCFNKQFKFKSFNDRMTYWTFIYQINGDHHLNSYYNYYNLVIALY